MSQEYPVKVNMYREAFAKAEQAMRFAEFSINNLARDTPDSNAYGKMPAETPSGVVIPSINELRYSAKHFADYMADGNGTETDEHLQRAIRHCIRARFDALRATVLFLVRDFRQFSEDYRMLNLDIEGIDAHRNTVEEVLDFLCENRCGDTEAECARLQDAIDRLRPFFIYSSSQRGRFNLLLAEMRESKRSAWIIGIIGCVGSAVLGYLLSKFF